MGRAAEGNQRLNPPPTAVLLLVRTERRIACASESSNHAVDLSPVKLHRLDLRVPVRASVCDRIAGGSRRHFERHQDMRFRVFRVTLPPHIQDRLIRCHDRCRFLLKLARVRVEHVDERFRIVDLFPGHSCPFHLYRVTRSTSHRAREHGKTAGRERSCLAPGTAVCAGTNPALFCCGPQSCAPVRGYPEWKSESPRLITAVPSACT